ncbi:MAG: hypothetical protein IKH03_07710 [Oscillospiraceae bacterium]|nr:hypothetical protein [Oscillospiraceae bacterium]
MSFMKILAVGVLEKRIVEKWQKFRRRQGFWLLETLGVFQQLSRRRAGCGVFHSVSLWMGKTLLKSG